MTTKSYLASSTYVLSKINNGLSFTSLLPTFVLNMSTIQYPGPFTLKSLIEGAKNYLLYPALSALDGYATGGSAGAVVVGASTVASQLVKDLTSGPNQEKSQAVVDAATRAAQQQFAPSAPPLLTAQTHPNTQVVVTPDPRVLSP